MGNPKHRWTPEEEQALKSGVVRYGAGKWVMIRKDPEFQQVLHSRSNIDLKDKWRNLKAPGHGSRDKSRVPRTIPSQDAPASSSVQVQTLAALPVSIAMESPAAHAKDDSGKNLPDAKIVFRYDDEMIFEALEEQENGMDIGSILAHIEERSEVPVPLNFRKQLGAKLRKLAQQEILVKAGSHYMLKNNTMETDTNDQKDNFAEPLPACSKAVEAVEEAAKTAAYKVIEAENMEFIAAEAVKNMEMYMKIAEETESVLHVAEEIFNRCSHGEKVLVRSRPRGLTC